MAWVYKPVRVEVTGGYGYGYGLAFSYPSKTRTRVTGVTGVMWLRITISTTTTTSSPLPPTTTTSRNLRSTAHNHHGTRRRDQPRQNDAATPQQPDEDRLARHHVAVNMAHQQYLPNVPRILTVATHAICSSNHNDDDDGWEVREEQVPVAPTTHQLLPRHDK
ncbi:hypothetical protein K443DRAFT_9698 [Laccaria amethystina LaAM-08-1]|uniref:Uncharacterized protein n=1 Tax=Laccaria amethystina LaAM-08-1 TaxID=1095629 RepID=A0A0C9XJA5_9AGAR|nr:hypothetical protein K443DRAFT_9698 [Laccaria amethystina LaAM-08-1]